MTSSRFIVTRDERTILLEEAHGVLSGADDLALCLAHGQVDDFRRLRQRVTCAAWIVDDLFVDADGDAFVLTVPPVLLSAYARREHAAMIRCAEDGPTLPHDGAYIALCERLSTQAGAPADECASEVVA